MKFTFAGAEYEGRPGETLAIVGVTGSGKTTLTSLVPRLYDVTDGRITIDGVDIRDVKLGSLRAAVATASSSSSGIARTIRAGIAA